MIEPEIQLFRCPPAAHLHLMVWALVVVPFALSLAETIASGRRRGLAAPDFPSPLWQRCAWASLGAGLAGIFLYGLAKDPLVDDASAAGVYWVAERFLAGLPMYPPLDGPEVYGLLYGPLTYLVYAAAIATGYGMAATAVAGFLPGMLAAWILVRMALAARGRENRAIAAGLLAAAAGVFPVFWVYAKGDPYLLLLAAVAAARKDARNGLAVTSACAGLAMNIKVTAGLCFLPILAHQTLVRRPPWTEAVMGLGTFALVFAAPFLHPRITLSGYLDWVLLAGFHRIEWKSLLVNALIAAPFAWLGFALVRDRVWGSALGLSFGLLLGAASKIGAGYYHFLPLVPSLLARAADAAAPDRRRARLPASLLLALSWAGVVAQVYLLLGPIQQNRGLDAAVKRDLRVLPPDAVVMTGWFRSSGKNVILAPQYDLPRRIENPGIPYLWNELSLSDLAEAGFQVPDAVRRRLAACEARHLATPRGTAPWDWASVYPPHHHLLPEDTRGLLRERYRRVPDPRSGEAGAGYFDVWECGPARAPEDGGKRR
ncbi:hypothetical protein [Methylococcus capsulatus]|uniref:hypothetical protein n=1 Tax=Methylococcus capsulatus TaxID=414 RepID=UPI001C52A50A|nr:hypothetical protein [Methylococcus capsulatus]QXP89627.1 hypothetical protein KW114_11010 [Methylococcus capsulatus]